jgi:hypothetical protein
MTILTGITSEPKQQTSFVLEDGTRVSMFLQYRPQQEGWFVDLSRGSWTVNGLRLTASPNLLVKWQKLVPFGLAIITANNVEPLNVADFATGVATMYLLNQDDVAAVNAGSFPGY